MNEKNIDIQTRADFSRVWEIIAYHRQRISKTIDDESLRMIWDVGAYVSYKLNKMVQLYETYSSESFTRLLEATKESKLIACQQLDSLSEIVPVETAQTEKAEFVPIELAQIPNVLFSTGWSYVQINSATPAC